MTRMWKGLVCTGLAALCCLLAALALADQTPRAKVYFYYPTYIGHLDQYCTISVTTRTPRLIETGEEEYELRNHRGEVLATARWHDPNDLMSFRVMVTEQLLGGHGLSVWYGGVQVSAEEGFAAFSDLSVPRVKQLEPEIPAISLTIVCGGDTSKNVDDILAVLDKYGVKCTFFFSGGYLEANTEDARRIVAAGHEIGSHGYQHVHMPDMTSYQQMRNVITKMTERCEELLGVTPRLFRAPFSDTNEKITALCRAEGQEDVMWNIDSRDWMDMFEDEPDQLIQRVTGPEAVSGSVIQFHINGYNTPEVLDAVIPYYQQECGFLIVPVGELMALSGRELPPMPDYPEGE